MVKRHLFVMMLAVLPGFLIGTQARAADVLVAAVLPASRAVAVNATATAFATIINTSASAAQGCSLALPAGFSQATFGYQTTDPATNQVTGTPNTPVSIAAGAAKTFVFSVTPTVAFAQTDLALRFACTSGETAAPISGVNTFLLTSSAQATPDIVALAATISNDGIVRTPGTQASGAFAIAVVNVGAAGTVIASVDTGGTTLPATFAICQTDAQAQCLQPPAASVPATFAHNQTGTFSVFVTTTGTPIALDPAHFRVFARFSVAGGSVGATSVAVQTQITIGSGGGTLQLGDVTLQVDSETTVVPTDFSATRVSDPAPMPPGVHSLNRSFQITPSNRANLFNHGLNAPVTLTIPYSGTSVTDPNKLVVLHFNSASGKYEPTTTHAIDTTAQTITFDSRSFSPFSLSQIDFFPDTGDAQFRPYANGFRIGNSGVEYLTPGGNCFGITAFALYYWSTFGQFNHLWSDFPFDNPAPPYSIQDILATRAQINMSAYWKTLGSLLSNVGVQPLSPGYAVYLAKLAITGGSPVVIRVGEFGGKAGHAVLLVAYDLNNFYYYDPNFPGKPTDPAPLYGLRSVAYSDFFGFEPYPDDAHLSLWTVVTAPSFGGGDSFAQILRDAQSGFAGSQNITVSAPRQGDNLSEYKTQLEATFGGNLNGASTAYLWRDGLSGFELIHVGLGSINQSHSVKPGQNTWLLLAGVQDFSGYVDNTLANAAAVLLRFNGPPPSIFHAQLHWTDPSTDMDLYVAEPGGEVAWYAHRTTASGLNHLIDVTSGFGPEDSILAAPSAPMAGNYTVRVHYYSDHGFGTHTEGDVTVTLYEGDSKKQVGPVSKHWQTNISGSQATAADGRPCCNQAPGSTGPDWVNSGGPLFTVDIVNGRIQ